MFSQPRIVKTFYKSSCNLSFFIKIFLVSYFCLDNNVILSKLYYPINQQRNTFLFQYKFSMYNNAQILAFPIRVLDNNDGHHTKLLYLILGILSCFVYEAIYVF